jgi:outer membrane protein assembly factor BamB
VTFSSSRNIAISIALFLMFAMATSLIVLPVAKAHDPPLSWPTYAFCSVAPNPIGVGQTVNVNFWLALPPPTASAQYGDRWQNMYVEVTRPDSHVDRLGPFTSDATGGTHTTYTPNTVGEYTFQMIFEGETLAGNNLGSDPSAYPEIGDYYEPSESNIMTLVVQDEPIPEPKVNPLPTQYWTRPIYGENNEWYSISGAWLGLAASTFAATGMYNATGNYNPYTTAPNTAHILWTKPEAFGGIIGGEFGGSQTANYYSTSQYEPKFAPIIMQGILYYTMYPGSSTYPQGWAAVDLHTGETLWTTDITNEVLKCGQIINMITPNQYGALAYLWAIPASASGFQAAGQYMSMYDAMTGAWILNITNTPSMTLTTDEGGNLIGYYLNTTTDFGTGELSASLSMWNSTRCINLSPYVSNYGGGGATPDQWMWRPPVGAQIDFQYGVQWSAPLPTEDTNGDPLTIMMSMFGMTFPSYVLSISAVQSNVVLLRGSTAGSSYLYQSGWSEEAGFSAIDGHKLWGVVNRTQVPLSIIYTGGVWSGSGAYVELTEATLSIEGFSLTNGQKLWGPTDLPNVSPFSTLGANAIVADGQIYIWLYGGDVYSYNIVTGDLNWEYHTPSAGKESPYGHNSIWTFTVGSIADGKLFVPEGHMYSPPLYHGAQQLALNLTTGEVVWSIDAFDVTSGPAISDGVMTTLNAYDNQIYGYGKGPTKLTVTAPDTADTLGTPIIVRGTITDISAGSQQQAVAANFPTGLPCISDESMSDWMEYVYMQQPEPTNATGVNIIVSVIDPNGNCYDVGTATSTTVGTFGLIFDPPVPGDYTIYATFEGSESYYASSAATYLYVTEAPSITPAATPMAASMTDTYVLSLGIASVIAIVVIGLVIILMLRKR